MVARKPELRQIPSGTSVTEVNLLTKRSWIGPQGEEQSSKCWVDVTFWGRQAETVCQYFDEGKPMFVDGRLVYSEWQTQEGQKRNKVQMTADNFQFISPPSGQAGPGSGSAEDGIPYFNKVFLMGNITWEPELRYVRDDRAVLKLGLATTRNWTDGGGQKQEETAFIDIDFWGKPAEEVSRLYKKGTPLFVEGYLVLDTWDDKETGEKRRKLKVTGENFRLHESFGSGPGAGADVGQLAAVAEQDPAPAGAHTEYEYEGGPAEGQSQEAVETEEEDVPF